MLHHDQRIFEGILERRLETLWSGSKIVSDKFKIPVVEEKLPPEGFRSYNTKTQTQDTT